MDSYSGKNRFKGVNTWWTARELAEARLPNFPHTSRKVSSRMRGARGALNNRGEAMARLRNGLEKGKKGGWEYHIEALPPICQMQLYQWDNMAGAIVRLHYIAEDLERVKAEFIELNEALKVKP